MRCKYKYKVTAFGAVYKKSKGPRKGSKAKCRSKNWRWLSPDDAPAHIRKKAKLIRRLRLSSRPASDRALKRFTQNRASSQSSGDRMSRFTRGVKSKPRSSSLSRQAERDMDSFERGALPRNMRIRSPVGTRARARPVARGTRAQTLARNNRWWY